jgi:hypothetical protein
MNVSLEEFRDGPVTSMDVSVREHARLRRLIRDIVTGLSLLGVEHPLARQLASLVQPPRQAPEQVIWGSLGFSWWQAAGERTGANGKQTAMAAALESGLNLTQSARAAGYREPCRKAGHHAARSNRVCQLRALAQEERARRVL